MKRNGAAFARSGKGGALTVCTEKSKKEKDEHGQMTDLQIWLNQTLGGELVFTGLVSMLPVVELRGGIPFGVGIGLPLPLAVVASVAGNMLPVPFLILFTRRVFVWLRRRIPVLEGMISGLE